MSIFNKKDKKQNQMEEIEKQLRIIASTIRSKINPKASLYQSAYQALVVALTNGSKEEIIERAKKEYVAGQTLQLFQYAAQAADSLYGHCQQIFGENKDDRWIQEYLKMAELRELLGIYDFDAFVSKFPVPGVTAIKKREHPKMLDAQVPGYILYIAENNINDPATKEKLKNMFSSASATGPEAAPKSIPQLYPQVVV
ncbi:hypothetical protein TRFO_29317 [Tritrichomonas foetus]|uniref:Uncharacterized protein n=1 Tax=Tritrichomonas foetus TaxID=1144522 RepID=A0A1J4K1I1_9EUKA|nr:hypothetical protein TRFO_29317 [Tritrichomonas foetus]|eukprot:OHT03333.1 hypothetical protein TRFO_29317 [Tritrichomonas foetus]